ncbi:hypothetical protein SAMN03159463_03157 [Mesorhizobium sp. NFR06]|nr:hypothetical protein SAMN03159463_03157 [Mesorhizobium sp. NFR06]
MSNKFPFVGDTLGRKLEAGTGFSVDCLTCKRRATLDVADLERALAHDAPRSKAPVSKLTLLFRPTRARGTK